MQDGPETRARRRGRQGQRRGTEIERDLGAQDGDDHLRDKIQRGDPGEQTQQQEEATEDLRYRHEMRCQFGQGKP
jgi:hypothetical protein